MSTSPRPIQFPQETRSNGVRASLTYHEPIALRTYTPTQAVFARSAGAFHFTPESRRLYDFSSGVLVANLGHNPRRWLRRLWHYLGWDSEQIAVGGTSKSPREGNGSGGLGSPPHEEYFEAVTLTAYNAMTELEAQATERLLASLRATEYGERLESVMWAASGSEAVQKALWACLHRDEERGVILATRFGFHGKKGLAGACTGSETDRDRDPRVRFLSFPREEVDDVSKYGEEFLVAPYLRELDTLWRELGPRINCLITEPYLGGGGSYHPPAAYLQFVQEWCRAHDVVFILDEVQSNFGRTGRMYAFEKYEIAPDIVCLGKGMGNGVPVNAAVGRADVFASLKYGEGSDTWSASPLGCAACLATLDEFEQTGVLEHAAGISDLFFAGLERLKETGLIAKVRGEGMVFGIECAACGEAPAEQVANEIVKTCYLGRPGGDGIHLLGPLAGKVLRVSPPLTITEEESRDSLELLYELVAGLAERLAQAEAALV